MKTIFERVTHSRNITSLRAANNASSFAHQRVFAATLLIHLLQETNKSDRWGRKIAENARTLEEGAAVGLLLPVVWGLINWMATPAENGVSFFFFTPNTTQ